MTPTTLATLGYTVRTPTAADMATKKAPKSGWHGRCIVIEYPDGRYAISESGLDGNGWAIAAQHYRKGLIK